MKLLHYFLGFNAIALSLWVFTNIMSSLETEVYSYIVCCLIFAVLASVGIYNIVEGFKKQTENNCW